MNHAYLNSDDVASLVDLMDEGMHDILRGYPIAERIAHELVDAWLNYGHARDNRPPNSAEPHPVYEERFRHLAGASDSDGRGAMAVIPLDVLENLLADHALSYGLEPEAAVAKHRARVAQRELEGVVVDTAKRLHHDQPDHWVHGM